MRPPIKPRSGDSIEGMEKALIYAREIDGPWLVRGSGSHRGMAAAARRNVRVVVERAYHEVIGGP